MAVMTAWNVRAGDVAAALEEDRMSYGQALAVDADLGQQS